MKGVIENVESIEELENLEQNENTNIIDLWTPCEFNIDENYEYVPKEDSIFSICSDFIYYVLTKIIYDFKIEGQENIENLEDGAISVSNHVLFLDCAMIGLAFKDKKIYYTTQEESFKIPFVRKLIKFLRAIPIPKGIENKKYFIKAISNLLKEKNIVHVYPEASLWPYCQKIRNFKNGAFDMAVRNQVPVVPCVFIFREPTGIRKRFKKKKDVTLKILKPVYSDGDKYIRQQVEELKEKTVKGMKDVIK